MTIMFNLVWMSYDNIAKPLFGDGERTIEPGDGNAVAASSQGQGVRRKRRSSLLWTREEAPNEEKYCLLD
jgi:hypothetical protein